MVGSSSNEAELVLEGFSQVVGRRSNGRDFIISPCVEASSAERIAKAFNETADRGCKAVVHSIRLPCFARNFQCQRQGLFGVDLRRFERVT